MQEHGLFAPSRIYNNNLTNVDLKPVFLTSISLLEQVSAARLNILWKPETRRVEAVLAAI